MTVSSSTSKVSYSGNGSLTVFAYTFKIFDQDDLTVILRASDGTETTQTITTHYTVSGVGSAGGGNVTFVTAPASGVTVVILREQPLTQELDLVPNDPFPAQSLEESLDKLVFMVQAHSEELDRAIKASKTNTISSTEFTISAADRANKVFAFDSSGDLSITQELGTWRGNWATSTGYNNRDLVRDTSTGSIYFVNSAHTSSGSEPLNTNPNSAKYDVIFNVGDMLAGTVSMSGDLYVNGNVTLGSDDNDAINVNGDIVGSLIPQSSGTYFLGNQYWRWQAAYVNRIDQMDYLQTSTFEGPINAKNNVTIGNSSLDRLTVNAYVDSDVVPSTDGTYDLGGTNKWADVKAVRVTSATLGNTVGNTTIDTSSGGGIILDAGLSGIELNAANGVITLKDEATTYSRLVNTSGNLRIDSGTTTAITFSGANATLAGTLDVTGASNFNDTTTSTSTTTGAVVIDGGVGIAENLNVGGDVILGGNLTVNGTTTTVNTTTINLSDNIITLNSDETGTPSQNSGIEIERGTSANVSLIWDESADKWTVGSDTFAAATIDLGNINFDAQQGTTSSTSLTTIASFAHASFSGGKLLVVATDGTDVQSTEILLVHNGSVVTSTQYGNVRTGGSDIATYSFAISGSDLLIQSTAAAATATTYNVSLMLG